VAGAPSRVERFLHLAAHQGQALEVAAAHFGRCPAGEPDPPAGPAIPRRESREDANKKGTFYFLGKKK
jgi:hypothetical protein